MHLLFLLRDMPSVDNIAPIIDACLRAGDDVIVLFDMPYDYKKCPRIQHLSGYENFRLIHPLGLDAKNRTVRRFSRFIWNAMVSKALLKKHQIDACFVEWGDGIDETAVPFISAANARRFIASIRDQIIRGSIELGIAVFCLPHGANTKRTIVASAKIKANMDAAGPDGMFANRNCFTRYVVDTEFFRRNMIDNYGLKEHVIEAWGAPRFSAHWLDVMTSFFPPANLDVSEDIKGLPICVFMMPKWHNDVDRPATIQLIENLVRSESCLLILKLHPRFGYSEIDGAISADIMSSGHLQTVGREIESSSLIKIADVVIDLGSSIALEVIARGKLLMYPKYLHSNTLVFDELGGGVIADDENAVLDVVSNLDQFEKDAALKMAIDNVCADSIYAGKAPHDIAAICRMRIHEIVSSKAA